MQKESFGYSDNKKPEKAKFQNKEELSKELKAGLEKIMNSPLFFTNNCSINTQLDCLTEKLIYLNTQVTQYYCQLAQEKNLKSSKELEDAAFSFFDLESINELLNKLEILTGTKSTFSKEINEFTNGVLESPINTIITPTEGDKYNNVQTGSGKGMNIVDINYNRFKTVIDILLEIFDLRLDEIQAVTGILSPKTMRPASYFRIIIEADINKLVYIGEYGNITHVFDINELKKLYADKELYEIVVIVDSLNKTDKKILLQIIQKLAQPLQCPNIGL